MTAHTQLLVYNSENRFVGSFYQFTCRVERTKGFFEKSVFWDRLFGTPCLSSHRGACQRKYTWMDLEATKGEQEED